MAESIISTDCDDCKSKALNPDCERCRLVWIVNKTNELRHAQLRYKRTLRFADRQQMERLEKLIDSALSKARTRHQATQFNFGANNV